MAIKTTLQTKFAAQKGLIIVLSLVLGLWGVYDYAVKIPRKQIAYDRGQVCFAVRQALSLDAEPEHIAEANTLLQAEMKKLADKGFQPEEKSEINPATAITSVETGNDVEWHKTLAIFLGGVAEAARRTPDAPPTDTFVLAADMSRAGVDLTADVSEPGQFDLFTQWMFILCLPFVPYFAWSFWTAKKKVYTLDDDGTLHAPEGTWSKDEIADIDMSKWMSKSIANVVNQNGARIKLDDYVYKNTHLIVGALASERYPDDWESDGRVKKDDVAPAGETEAAAETPAGDDAPAEDSAKAAAEA